MKASRATLWLPYAQMQTTIQPLEAVKTQNTTITLRDGRQLIDAVASWWTACHGYNHPHIIQAIQEQTRLMPHVMMGGLVHPQAQQLCERLSALLPEDLNYVFFSESGSVSVEIAMKMALQYWINRKEPARARFVYFKHGYHGDTFFTMSVCDPYEGMHQLFHRVLPEQFFQAIPSNDEDLNKFETWLTQNAPHIAALMIEPLVQGAGGMKMHSPHILKSLVQICQRHGMLVIADEIFTGFGRTGSLFAIEQAQVVPDIICLSKALTAGTLPLAATIAKEHVYQAFLGSEHEKALMHGTTFMGNATACAAANASLDLFDNEPRLAQVADLEGILKSELSPLTSLAGVKEVRVKGAIGVVQLARPILHDMNWFKAQFIEDGIWCRPLGDIVYTTPAFTIEHDALRQITQSIVKQVTRWSTQFYCA